MSNALKCDRCGKLYERYQGVSLIDGRNKYCSITLNTYLNTCLTNKDMDMCPECMRRLIFFINNVEDEVR